jgi:HPt (histidine-containing phosphotransfer) domain-containing protein
MGVDVLPVYSELAGDEEFREFVILFVGELPEKILPFRQKLSERKWAELGLIAHQMKGSAGSYGFGEISEAALELETLIKTNQPELQITNAVQKLITLCQHATAEPNLNSPQPSYSGSVPFPITAAGTTVTGREDAPH